MRVGVPKEIKIHEYRVGLTPASVAELIAPAMRCSSRPRPATASISRTRPIEKAGATILPDADAVFAAADMIVKVKEPQPQEIAMLEPRHILFTYLHLAADKPQAEGLMKSGATCIAYETVTASNGSLPLLKPMSEVAGRMSIQVGAHYLEKEQGGRGVLLGGVPGVAPAKVAILGGGVVRRQRGADGDRHARRRHHLRHQQRPAGRARHVLLEPDQDRLCLARGDRQRGQGSRAGDRRGAGPGRRRAQAGHARHAQDDEARIVLVDIAIDQGGCFETSHATTHDDPVYEVDGIIHYCVANMPGAVARTSAFALNNATLPFALKIANLGAEEAMQQDPHLANGLNVSDGKIRHEAVAEALDLAYVPA